MPGKRPSIDISADAHSLARIADRLPCGLTHQITIIKPPSRKGWTIMVAEVTQTKETGQRS